MKVRVDKPADLSNAQLMAAVRNYADRRGLKQGTLGWFLWVDVLVAITYPPYVSGAVNVIELPENASLRSYAGILSRAAHQIEGRQSDHLVVGLSAV